MELQLDLTKRYTFADYLTWADDKRRELINGFINLMTPAPRRIHQEISVNLEYCFKNYLKEKKCRMYHAPFDVRLPKSKNGIKDEEIYTVVQPDICVICDLSKLDDKGCLGAPDLIVEIVSASSVKIDVEEKFKVYQDSGVREYWIVFPEDRTINVFVLDNNLKYQLIGMFAGDSMVKVNIFKDMQINLAEIFDV